jgi:hypothetical protein
MAEHIGTAGLEFGLKLGAQRQKNMPRHKLVARLPNRRGKLSSDGMLEGA